MINILKINFLLLFLFLSSFCAYGQGSFPFDEDYTKQKIVRSTYSKTLKRAEKFLDRSIRKARRSGFIKKEITPLEWWKQDFLMTLDPSKGRPTPEVLFPVLQNLNTFHKINKRGTPGTKSTPWKSRGPNNVGGRTRALAWDASDSKQMKVFAGGVTGGLWVNSDISSANSKWEQVGGIWPNLNVTCIAQDPNDHDIWYVGTGEGFGTTSSTSRGFGIFKSTDGGETWSHLSNTSSYYYVNDIVVRDESGTSVVYAGVDILYYQGTYHGNNTTVGLFRSTNGGTSWSNVAPKIPSQSHYHAVSDIEIDADNKLWIGTRKNPYASSSDQGGGRIYYSSNGTSFTESYKNTSALGGRVEVACAPSSSDTLYAVIESGGKAQNVVRSFNGGSSWSTFTEPADADNGIPNTDFTRGQAWYDLIIAVNPVDASELIIGGINFFMSTQAGSNWKQISKWSENASMNSLKCSYVHADMHAAIYSNDGKRLVVGTDGGVFYAGDIRNNPWNRSTAFVERNNNYVITQFYSGTISQNDVNFMMAGAQDNGTHYTQDTGLNDERQLWGGDGAYCFIHPESDNKLVFSYVRNNFYGYVNSQLYTLARDNNTGAFINPAGLDFVNDNLFMRKSDGKVYRNSITGSTSTLTTITFASTTEGNASAFYVMKTSSGKARIYIGTNKGKVYYSNNPEASTPTFTALGSVNSGNITSIESLGDRGDTMFLTLSNYGIKNIYVSTNGGTSWVAKDGNLPNMPVWDILGNPNSTGEVLVATEVGMYHTTNIFASNPTWTTIHEGMGPVKTMMIDYNKKYNLIMASTHGRGIFTSNAWLSQSPLADFEILDTLLCTNTNVTLTNTSLNDPDVIRWRVNPSTDVSFVDSDSTSKNATLKIGTEGDYTITLYIEKQGEVSSKNVNVKVLPSITNSLTLTTNPETYCKTEDVTLSVNYGDSKLFTLDNPALNWYINGSELTSNYNKDQYVVKAPQSNGNQFIVYFTADYACLSPKIAASPSYSINAVNVPTLSINRNWDTLYSNYSGQGKVTWYRNGLQAATGEKYTLINNGDYYAKVSLNQCTSEESNTISYNSLNLVGFENGVLVGPNPLTDKLFVSSRIKTVMSVFNAKGQLILKRKLKNNDKLEIPTTKWSPGIYTVRWESSQGTSHKKIVCK